MNNSTNACAWTRFGFLSGCMSLQQGDNVGESCINVLASATSFIDHVRIS